MTRLIFESHDLGHGHLRSERGIGLDEAGLVILNGLDHGSLGLGGLRTIDKGHAALGGQGNAHVHAGNGLHDGRNHGDVKGNCGLLAALETRQRRLERNVVGDAFR